MIARSHHLPTLLVQALILLLYRASGMIILRGDTRPILGGVPGLMLLATQSQTFRSERRHLLLLAAESLASSMEEPGTSRPPGARVTEEISSRPLIPSRDEKPSSPPTRPRRPLQGCVCLVTGASRGIGKGIALELGQAGAIVYVTGTTSSKFRRYVMSPDGETTDNPSWASSARSPYLGPYSIGDGEDGPGSIEETADLVTRAGGLGIPVLCNHAVDAQVQGLMQRIQQEYGRLDILVNNAFRLPKGGVQKLNSKFWDQGPELWDAVHTVGLRSHYVATCFAMPLLLQSRRLLLAQQQQEGQPSDHYLPRPLIAMISSFGGLTYTFNVAYGVGKAGVDRLAKDMAVELAEHGITVVSFWPGVVQTERTLSTVASGDWDRYVGIPLEQSETPALTGRAVVAVATDVDNTRKSGTYQVVAELAEEYDFTDVQGRTPPSIRSLRFLLPAYGMDPDLRARIPNHWIPNWKLPFWVMAQGRPPKPE